MDWQSIKQYIFNNRLELIIGVIIGGLLVTFLFEFLKGLLKLIIKSIKTRKQHKVIKCKIISFNLNQLQKPINSKKYLPGTHIEINQVKERLRFFCFPLLFCNKLIDSINRLNFSYFDFELMKCCSASINITKIHKTSIHSFKSFNKKAKEIINILNNNIKLLNKISTDKYSFGQVKSKLNDALEKARLLEAKVLLVLDDAGQGKTNLLCDLLSEFLFKLKIPSALFFGSDFYGLDINAMKSIVAERLTGNSDFTTFNKFIENESKKKKKYFVIIIDALNESNDGNFVNALDVFISDMLNNKFVKIILTCRTEYYNLNFKMIETSSYASNIMKIEGINSKLEEHEKDTLFRKYLAFFNIKWESFSGRVYEKLVSNFLLLRIFCEVYQSQNIGSILDVYMLDLFQKYHRQVKESIKKYGNENIAIEKVFCEVIRYMIDNQKYKDVSIQEIVDKVEIEKSMLNKLVDENIFFRRDIADKVGVLLDLEVINFTFDEFRDYLIADYLSNVLLTKDKLKAEKFILNEITPEKTLFEGVSKYLFFISKKDPKNEFLSSILKTANWYPSKYIHYLFETNDEDLTIEDIEKIKAEFLFGGDKSELVLRMLINYRFDMSVYKKLNISLLYSLLVEMSEIDRAKKFEKYFQSENSQIKFGFYEGWINLNPYFEFVANSIKNGDSKNPALEFLFIIVTCNLNHQFHSKAENIFNLFCENYPDDALDIFGKYLNCSNQDFKEKANSMEKSIRIKRR